MAAEPFETMEALEFDYDDPFMQWQVDSSLPNLLNSSESQQNVSTVQNLQGQNGHMDLFLSPLVLLNKSILFADVKDEIAALSTKHKEDIWILDSRASIHTTPHKSDFSELTPLKVPIPIQIADKHSKTYIMHVGTVYMKHTNENNVTQIIKLEPVYYQPHSLYHLLSQGSILC